METAFWIVTGIVAATYVIGWMMIKGWILGMRRPLGTLLRQLGIVAAIGLVIWAAIINLVL